MAHESPRVDILASTLVTGGAERVVEALVLGLSDRGFSPRVLCLHEPGEVGSEIANAGTPLTSHIMRSRFDPSALARLAGTLRSGRSPVLLSLDHHDAIFAGALAARCAGVPHRLLAVHSTGLWGGKRTLSRIDRFVLGAYERIIALAKAHADYLVEREGVARDRLTVIANGIDTERFRAPQSPREREAARISLSIPRERFVVTIVAALRPEKNHGMLLDAARRIAERRADFLFLIVGEGREGEALRARARELSLAESVRFMGLRSNIPEILAASDVSVLCSWPIVETFPLAVLEAMACGLPVVATDVGAVREMLVDGEEGFVIKPGDTEALIHTLIDLAENLPTREMVGKRARGRVEREFGIENMINSYANLLHEIVK